MGVSAGGKPASADSEPDVGSKERLRLGLALSLSGARGLQGTLRRGGGVFNVRTVTAVLKGGHPLLLALPPRNRGVAGAACRGRVGRSMAAGVGGSRCGSPRCPRGRGSWWTGLGRRAPHVADGL